MALGSQQPLPMRMLEAFSGRGLLLFHEADGLVLDRKPDWIGVDVNGHRAHLRARESVELEGYYIYVERLGSPGIPGESPCLAIVGSSDWTIRNAALRSAVLMLQGQPVFIGW